MIIHLWLLFFFAQLFVLGCVLGSFLNVVIYRLPRGKNLFWPSSRCGACLKPISSWDNVPLLSYWRLGGRCRACGATFSARYFAVELLTGLVFALLYYLEIGINLHGLPVWGTGGMWSLTAGMFPSGSWGYFIGHALLACLLISATGILLDTGDIPLSLAVTGGILGLFWAMLFPWPEPTSPYQVVPRVTEERLTVGFMPWPVWEPVPLAPSSVGLGLLSGLAGLVVGQGILRLVNGLHRVTIGRVVFGNAAPAVLLMTGSFLGWQPTVVALVLALALAQPMSGRCRSVVRGFSLGLIISVGCAWLGWVWVGPLVRPWLFDVRWVSVGLVILTSALFGLGWGLRMGPSRARSVLAE